MDIEGLIDGSSFCNGVLRLPHKFGFLFRDLFGTERGRRVYKRVNLTTLEGAEGGGQRMNREERDYQRMGLRFSSPHVVEAILPFILSCRSCLPLPLGPSKPSSAPVGVDGLIFLFPQHWRGNILLLVPPSEPPPPSGVVVRVLFSLHPPALLSRAEEGCGVVAGGNPPSLNPRPFVGMWSGQPEALSHPLPLDITQTGQLGSFLSQSSFVGAIYWGFLKN